MLKLLLYPWQTDTTMSTFPINPYVVWKINVVYPAPGELQRRLLHLHPRAARHAVVQWKDIPAPRKPGTGFHKCWGLPSWVVLCSFLHVVRGGVQGSVTIQLVLEPQNILEAEGSGGSAYGTLWNSLSHTHIPHWQQRHFWHSSGQLAGTHRDQRLSCGPWLSSRSLSAGQARALCCELCDPREPAESGPKKCLSHPCICKAYKEQSYFSLIANYSSWQASLPPTFIHFGKNPIKSPFSPALQWADSISLVCLPNSHTSYQMLAPNNN